LTSRTACHRRDAAADAGAQSDPHHVVDAACRTEPPFGQGGGGPVVDAADGHAELRLEGLAQRESLDAEHFPREVPRAERGLDDAGQGDADSEQARPAGCEVRARVLAEHRQHGVLEPATAGVLEGRALDPAIGTDDA